MREEAQGQNRSERLALVKRRLGHLARNASRRSTSVVLQAPVKAPVHSARGPYTNAYRRVCTDQANPPNRGCYRRFLSHAPQAVLAVSFYSIPKLYCSLLQSCCVHPASLTADVRHSISQNFNERSFESKFDIEPSSLIARLGRSVGPEVVWRGSDRVMYVVYVRVGVVSPCQSRAHGCKPTDPPSTLPSFSLSSSTFNT
jgi:hypothetical protein